jgi:hypothetical protein
MAASNGSGMAGSASHCGEPESNETLLMLVEDEVADVVVAASDVVAAVVAVSESGSIESTRMESSSCKEHGEATGSGTVCSTEAEMDNEGASVAIEGEGTTAAAATATAELSSVFADNAGRALVTRVDADAGADAGAVRVRVAAEADAGRVCCERFAVPLLARATAGAAGALCFAEAAERGRAATAADATLPVVAAVPEPVCCVSTCDGAVAVGGRDTDAGADSRASSICASL